MAAFAVHPAGDTALVVAFDGNADIATSERVLALAASLEAAGLDGLVETVPTIRSLLIHYEPLCLSPEALTAAIEAFAGDFAPAEPMGRTWRIPVCYDPAFGLDLGFVADRCGCSVADVIERHATGRYHVYMLGFLPGLAYLGDLPPELTLPRRDAPRPRIAAGSVGIGTNLTVIYPADTPCGWHLLGRSPVALWDWQRQPGALFAPGDKVTFEPVSMRDYERMKADPSDMTPIQVH